MKLGEVFPSNYIKASDLQGREVNVVIARAVMEKLGDDDKLVLYFQNRQKGMVCNKTNANRIALAYGDDTDDWIGREIVIYPDIVDFQGKAVEAIRAKPPLKAAPLKRQAEDDFGIPNDPIGF